MLGDVPGKDARCVKRVRMVQAIMGYTSLWLQEEGEGAQKCGKFLRSLTFFSYLSLCQTSIDTQRQRAFGFLVYSRPGLFHQKKLDRVMCSHPSSTAQLMSSRDISSTIDTLSAASGRRQ